MDLYTAIRTVLLADTDVTAIVGASSAARIWSCWPRTYTVPALVIEDDSDELQNDLSGHSGMTISQVTITCRADTAAAAQALLNAVKGIAGHAGTFDLVIDSIAASNTPKGDGSDTHWYDRLLSCTVLVTEVV